MGAQRPVPPISHFPGVLRPDLHLPSLRGCVGAQSSSSSRAGALSLFAARRAR